jgi:hypothetical protein
MIYVAFRCKYDICCIQVQICCIQMEKPFRCKYDMLHLVFPLTFLLCPPFQADMSRSARRWQH